MWINYHHLYYFKTIAEEQSVSRAAEKLRLGQPTLSAQLRLFEDYLDVKLFDRQHKKLILTEQGRIALEYSKEIFKLGSEMVDALNDRAVPGKIKLQIGALDAIPKEFLVEFAQAGFKKNNIQMSFIEGDLNHLMRQLDVHDIDVVVTNHLPLAKSNQKKSHFLAQKNEIKIYGTTEYKTLKKNFPDSLKNQKMILPNYDSQLRSDLDHWFKLRSIDVDVVCESQDMALKKQLALKGLGLVASTEAAMKNEMQSHQIFEIGSLSNVFENIFLLTQERKILNPALKTLLKQF
jgi:LysR family transcriptional regulator, transcriptional activator of nhaA